MSPPAAIRLATFALLALGVGLRTFQYAAQASMWLDELAVAHTLIVRSLPRLVTEPLAYYQVAPAGFLALQKLSITAFGQGELAFRLVPWLASIIALLLFWRLAFRTLRPLAGLTALALFAASPALTAYAAQAKQYSTDVAATVALLWAGEVLLHDPSRKRAAAAILAGSIALLISMSAVLSGAAAGTVLLWSFARTHRPRTAVLLVTGACWVIAAATTVSLARLTLSPATRDYMQSFWASGFPPPPWSGLDALFWIPQALSDALGHFVFWFIPEDQPAVAAIVTFLAVAALAGAWWLWRRNRATVLLFVAPILAAVIAAALRLLPLEGRVSLWIGAPLLLLAGAGLAALPDWLPKRLTALPALIAVILGGAALAIVLVLEPPPYLSQDVRPVLEQLARQRQPGDRIYVYYGARQAVRFYGPRVGLSAWSEGRCHRRDTRAYFEELDAFRGDDRVWVIWTHAIPRFGEPEAIRSYLSSIGIERLRFDAASGSEGGDAAQALLYDLSDPGRLALDSADRHVIPSPISPDEGPNVPCGGPANDASVVR